MSESKKICLALMRIAVHVLGEAHKHISGVNSLTASQLGKAINYVTGSIEELEEWKEPPDPDWDRRGG